jgi:hypothetical protein
MTPFWHAVDLFWARTADELAAALERAGIDLRRGGYARTNRSTDGVALTLGARGEGEVDLPQIWFAREPLWPTRVFFPASGEAAVGPPGPDGWPSWLLVGDETLIEIVGIPFSAPSPPPWARPISDAHRPRTASPGDSHPIFGDLLR